MMGPCLRILGSLGSEEEILILRTEEVPAILKLFTVNKSKRPVKNNRGQPTRDPAEILHIAHMNV